MKNGFEGNEKREHTPFPSKDRPNHEPNGRTGRKNQSGPLSLIESFSGEQVGLKKMVNLEKRIRTKNPHAPLLEPGKGEGFTLSTRQEVTWQRKVGDFGERTLRRRGKLQEERPI